MSMLLQQMRRATFPRKAAALTPPSPLAYSRLFSTTKWVEEVTAAQPWGVFWLKYGLAFSYAYGLCYLTDFGGYRKSVAEWAIVDKENEKIWEENSKLKGNMPKS